MEKEVLVDKLIEDIMNKTNSLQKEVSRLGIENKKLEKEISKRTKELEISKDGRKAKIILAENMELKKKLDELQQRLNINQEIVKLIMSSFKEVRNSLRLDLKSRHIEELFEQNIDPMAIYVSIDGAHNIKGFKELTKARENRHLENT